MYRLMLWFMAPLFCMSAFAASHLLPRRQRFADQDRLMIGMILSRQNMPCAYFEGEPIKVDSGDGSFMLRVTRTIDTLYVLVCEHCAPKTKRNTHTYHENTVEYLQLDPEQDYKCYKFTKILETTPQTDSTSTETNKNRPPAEQCFSWKVEEAPLEQAEQGNLKIPANTFIVVLQPDLVREVRAESWPIDDTVMRFAQIVIRDDVPEDELIRQVTRSHLEDINMRTTHKMPETITRQHESMIVSMISR